MRTLVAAPERTVRHRLDRLREHGLVASVRAGPRDRVGTGALVAAPGRRAVGRREQRAPSGMHVAHAAAIAEVWLALREQGPAIGLEASLQELRELGVDVDAVARAAAEEA